MKRRRLIPEVIQTSAMDCGPACLAALLAGFGVRASYERLREACRTDVDGTSIDTIEEAAVQLGLAAEQNVLPVDHVLRPEALSLPAIAITQLPDGGNHVVVLWNQLGDHVQVMDPAAGRRWVRRARLLEELYVHEMPLPGEIWRAWAETPERAHALRERIRALGIADAAERVRQALADPTWRAVAVLDAATRMVAQLRASDAVAAGAEAAALLAVFVADPATLPPEVWGARATDDPETVRIRGAVIVRVTGVTEAAPTSADLIAALAEPRPRPWRHLIAAARAGGRHAPHAIALGVVLSALAIVVQAVLWRALFETRELDHLQLAGAIGTLVAFLAIDLALEVLVVDAIFRLGRRVEGELRAGFLASIARLGLRYLRSRPMSDLAERSHALHRLRELPWLGAQLARVTAVTLLTGAALIWLAPRSAWAVAGLVGAVVLPPLLAHGALAERELRARSHNGALARFFLDALLGATAVRTHGLEQPLRIAHESRLVAWTRAVLREHLLASAIVAVQTVLVCGFAIALVAIHVDAGERPATLLLAVYWTLMMAASGGVVAGLLRELPAHRNSTLRLREPLGARAEAAPPAAGPVVFAGSLRFSEVSVVAGGHPVLSEITLEIPAGQHVAIVGASGSGKSTLLGLLLGWHRPAAGAIAFGDVPLDHAALVALRAQTAWIDPDVQLWNDSLAHNLAFGTAGEVDLAGIVAAAQLDGVLGRLPEGMQTRLGESGGLLSGGEGQRVRIGRALARTRPALVLLDEPCRGIDRPQRQALVATLRARWADATLLCATHDLADTATFDRVLVVDGGRIVEDGAPAALAADAGSRYARLLAEELRAAEAWHRWRRVRVEQGHVVEAPR